MKKGILLLMLVSSFFAQAQQSLKDALFGGKLKNDAGTVIRKGEDLSTKIDTVRKAPNTAALSMDSVKKVSVQTIDSTSALATNNGTVSDSAATTNATTAAKENAAAPKDNNAVWKTFMDTVVSSLKTEVLSSKKIKSGSYYVLVSYAIGADGQVSVNDVFLQPENAFLQQQIKDRLAIDTPRLTPAVSSSGAPRKINKKYNFTLTKE